MDAQWIFTAQAGRAFGYGLAAVLLGTTLAASGLTPTKVGLVLAAIVAGTVVANLAVGALADRIGRRRTYLVLYLALAGSGAVYASTSRWPVLVAVALIGVLSTDVVQSGPFATVEQTMLATAVPGQKPLVTGFGWYNAIAAAAGSLGALAAGGPHLLRRVLPAAPADQRYFLTLTAAALLGAYAAARLSPAVEAKHNEPTPHPAPKVRMVPAVWRLAGLFAVDSFAGGFVVDTFIVYWLQHRYGASTALAGLVLFTVGLLQTASFLVAPRIGHRIGLLPTMVLTHLPSNVLLAALAFAPNLPTTIALLLANISLSEMDVPNRQTYVMALVTEQQRTRAAAITNTSRYLTRPVGTALLGPAQMLMPGLPFLLAGIIKIGYDLTLWTLFRRVRLHNSAPGNPPSQGTT